MKNNITNLLIGASMLVGLAACDSNPPSPLKLAEIPAAIGKEFEKASGETALLTSQILENLRTNGMVAAKLRLEALCSQPALTSSQRLLASRALLAINQELAQAAAQGNAEARQILQHHQSTK